MGTRLANRIKANNESLNKIEFRLRNYKIKGAIIPYRTLRRLETLYKIRAWLYEQSK